MVVKQMDSYALEWIKLRSLTLAKSINKTTLEALGSLIASFEFREDMAKTAKAIEHWFDTNEQWKAQMIARTETIAAYNEGTLHRFELEGVKMVEWMAAPDSCSECAAFDAQVFDVKDSHGMIPLHNNCRCTWLTV